MFRYPLTDFGPRRALPVQAINANVKHQWVDRGKLRLRWLALACAGRRIADAAGIPPRVEAGRKLGEGVSLTFIREDAVAIYWLSHRLRERDRHRGGDQAFRLV